LRRATMINRAVKGTTFGAGEFVRECLS
jgi:hypothetical protein